MDPYGTPLVMCIQKRYLKGLQFCAAPVQQSVPQYIKIPCLQSFLPCFKVPFSPSVSFSKLWLQDEFYFPCRNNPDFLMWLPEDVLTAVMTCSHLFSAFKTDLFVFRSQCDRTHVLCCSAGCSAEISYACGSATGQMRRAYALSPYLDTAGNLSVFLLFQLSLGDVLTKHCLGPCDISLHLLLCCWWLAQCKAIWRFPWIAVPFSTGICHFIVRKKPTVLGLSLTLWGLVAFANMQRTI